MGTTMDYLFDFAFMDGWAARFSVTDILVALAISLAIGLFIMFIYTKTFKGVMYSSSFAHTLIGMNMITTLVIMAIASHFLIGFGMIGALSIIRFRTVVKEPLDLVYLFWSIAVGILVGAGFVVLAVVGSVVIGLVLFLFQNHRIKDSPYVVVFSCDNEKAENKAFKLIDAETKKHVTKAKTVSKEGVELTVEVRLKNSSSQFVNKLLGVGGVRNATLVSYNGDFYM